MKCRTVIDPNRDEEVLICLQKPAPIAEKIEAFVRMQEEGLVGYAENTVIPIAPADITCFFVEAGKTYALKGQTKLCIRSRLYQIEEQLDESFVKINQSCLANIREIERFDVSIGGSLLVRFKNSHTDYVSRRQLKIVKERIGFHL